MVSCDKYRVLFFTNPPNFQVMALNRPLLRLKGYFVFPFINGNVAITLVLGVVRIKDAIMV